MGGVTIFLAIIGVVILIALAIAVWGVFLAGIEDREHKGKVPGDHPDSEAGVSGGTSS